MFVCMCECAFEGRNFTFVTPLNNINVIEKRLTEMKWLISTRCYSQKPATAQLTVFIHRMPDDSRIQFQYDYTL